ncbi:MAG: helix-turn-helix transcriptional regulator [Paludibacteraceae bacterium]
MSYEKQPIVNGQAIYMLTGEQIDLMARAFYEQFERERKQNEDDSVLTPQETMALIGVSRTTLWQWEREKRNLQPHRVGKKCFYFRREVYEYLKNH